MKISDRTTLNSPSKKVGNTQEVLPTREAAHLSLGAQGTYWGRSHMHS